MTRCIQFYEKVEREGPDWCEKCPEAIRQIENYMDLVKVMESQGIPKEKTFVGLPEGAARPLLAIRDANLKDKCISSVKNALELQKNPLNGRFTNRLTVKSIEQIISNETMAPRREELIQRGKDAAANPDGIKLYQGDFLTDYTRIPAGTIDCIITDPPYVKEWLHNFDAFGKAAAHVLKPGGFLVSYVGHIHLDKILMQMTPYLDYYWILCLKHSGQRAAVYGRMVQCTMKPILVFQKPPETKPKRYFNDFIQGQGREKDAHEWQQGEEELRQIFEPFTDPGDVVLDPFMGSGTVIAMAKKMKRHAIGFDIDGQNVAIVRGRVS
jgi:hypothetical protein